MAFTDSNPFSITIAAAPTTVLAQCAAAMPAGTWRRFNGTTQDGVAWPVPADQTLALYSNANATTGHLPYVNKMPWNPVGKRIEVVAQDHGNGGMRVIEYHEATHRWFDLGRITPNLGGHGYDHSAVNPHTGEVFYKTYGGWDPVLTCYRYPYAQNDAAFTAMPTQTGTQWMTNGGTFWWSGPFTGGSGLGAQGGFGLYTRRDMAGDWPSGYSATDGALNIFDPLTNSWAFKRDSASPYIIAAGGPVYEYNAVAAYSAVHNCAVYGGGTLNERRLWKLSSDGSVTTLTNAPRDVGIHNGMLCCDPVTGNFLIFDDTQLYELNPTGTGTYTLQTGNRVPPGVFGGAAINGTYGCCVEMPTHGVIAVIWQRNGNGQFWLYKHA